MTRSPSFVARAGVSEEALADLELAADRATGLRAKPGVVVLSLLPLCFALGTELNQRLPRLSFWLAATSLVLGVVRLRVLARVPGAHTRSEELAVWRWAAAATFNASVGFYGLYVALSIHLLDVCMTTLLMLLASSGLSIGVAHAHAPRSGVMRTGMIVLIGPPLAAVLAASAPARYTLAGLLAFQLGYALLLGARLNREYWESAVAQAQLQNGRDDLARSQRQMLALIENVPDPMGLVSEGRVVFVNPAWATSLQRERAELVFRSLDGMVCAEDAERLQRCLTASGLSEEVRILRGDGTLATWELRTGQPLDHAGRPARPVVARDVTERNRMRAQLLVAERLTALGTLTAGVAHEINNPLTYVLANVEAALADLGPLEVPDAATKRELTEMLGEALEGAGRVRDIVRDLKTFSRVDEASLAMVDLRRVVDFATKVTANEVRHRAHLTVSVPDATFVVANDVKLGQVLVNLLLNAAQAIPEGAAEDNEIRVVARVEGDRVVVDVQDTGAGIAPAHLPRIFDPFFTTKPVGEGTGLGLSMCHAIMASFGGAISVASDVGRGTTFTVRLVLGRDSRKWLAAPAPVSGAGRRARVLVVDDEPAVGATLQRFFRHRYEFVGETEPSRALARLEAGEVFDVVLCDLMMPCMTGMDVFAYVAERLPSYAPKFVFMTGGAFTQSAKAFLERVANVRVEKPFDLPGLSLVLDARLRSHERLA